MPSFPFCARIVHKTHNTSLKLTTPQNRFMFREDTPFAFQISARCRDAADGRRTSLWGSCASVTSVSPLEGRPFRALEGIPFERFKLIRTCLNHFRSVLQSFCDLTS
jgi:hypothetical protein